MKTYVADTLHNGKGIFAVREIVKDELIFIAQGSIVQEKYDPLLYGRGERWLGVGHETWINSPPDNPIYFMNHSCNPSAGLEGRVKIVALRTIKNDEEITIDYALTEEDPYWRMNCNCGEEKCRKVIVGTARFKNLSLDERIPHTPNTG